MIDRLNQFTWHVAKSGYEWMKVCPLMEPGTSGGAKYPFLTDRVRPGVPYETKLYAPLQGTGLFIEFATLSADRVSIQEFANRHGLLTGGEPIPIGNVLGHGERLDLWKSSIAEMKRLYELWCCLVGRNDAADLGQSILWRANGVSYKKGGHYRLIASKERTPELWGTFREGDLFKPAWHVLQQDMNAQLESGIAPRLMWNTATTGLSLYQVPRDLLSAMWLQFARAVDGNRQYNRCKECRNWFEVSSPDGGRKDKEFCGSACRARYWRKQNASLIG